MRQIKPKSKNSNEKWMVLTILLIVNASYSIFSEIEVNYSIVLIPLTTLLWMGLFRIGPLRNIEEQLYHAWTFLTLTIQLLIILFLFTIAYFSPVVAFNLLGILNLRGLSSILFEKPKIPKINQVNNVEETSDSIFTQSEVPPDYTLTNSTLPSNHKEQRIEESFHLSKQPISVRATSDISKTNKVHPKFSEQTQNLALVCIGKEFPNDCSGQIIENHIKPNLKRKFIETDVEVEEIESSSSLVIKKRLEVEVNILSSLAPPSLPSIKQLYSINDKENSRVENIINMTKRPYLKRKQNVVLLDKEEEKELKSYFFEQARKKVKIEQPKSILLEAKAFAVGDSKPSLDIGTNGFSFSQSNLNTQSSSSSLSVAVPITLNPTNEIQLKNTDSQKNESSVPAPASGNFVASSLTFESTKDPAKSDPDNKQSSEDYIPKKPPASPHKASSDIPFGIAFSFKGSQLSSENSVNSSIEKKVETTGSSSFSFPVSNNPIPTSFNNSVPTSQSSVTLDPFSVPNTNFNFNPASASASFAFQEPSNIVSAASQMNVGAFNLGASTDNNKRRTRGTTRGRK